MTQSEPGRIEKAVVIRAPIDRVWRALATSSEFSVWFCATVDGPFRPGARVGMTSTYEGAKGVAFYVDIERMDAPERFSWVWHPGVPPPGMDYSSEPATSVEFTLEEIAGGTRVTVVESGFDRLPPSRRDAALKENEKGWEIQTASLESYVSKHCIS